MAAKILDFQAYRERRESERREVVQDLGGERALRELQEFLESLEIPPKASPKSAESSGSRLDQI